jgi:hypothetical protein
MYVMHFIQTKIDTYQIICILMTVKDTGIPIYTHTAPMTVCHRAEDDLTLGGNM